MESDIPLKKNCVKKIIGLKIIEHTWKWQLKASLFEQAS